LTPGGAQCRPGQRGHGFGVLPLWERRKKLLRCQGIYTATNNDGKWGIQLMSTISTPADMMNVVYNDTIEAAKRLRENHDLAFS